MPFINPYRRTGELSEIEQWKLERHPLEVADAIIDTYSVEGAGAIGKVKGEVERLKWVGIYPQRQGGDAFMLRIKIPGGHLTAPQLREIGVIADAFGEGPDGTESRIFGTAMPTSPPARRCRSTGSASRTSPASGGAWPPSASPPCRPAATPLATWLAARCRGSTPKRHSTPFHRPGHLRLLHRQPRVRQPAPEVQDLGHRLPGGLRQGRYQRHRAAAGPDRRRHLGLQRGCGGRALRRRAHGLRHRRLRDPDQAVEITRAIAQTFGELGNRENRGLARMRYLVEELGAEGFRRQLGARARFDLVPAGEDLTRRYRGDHIGVHPEPRGRALLRGLLRAGGADERH